MDIQKYLPLVEFLEESDVSNQDKWSKMKALIKNAQR